VTVQRSLSTVFKSLQKALDYPIPLLSSGAFNPASVSGLRSRLLDANTFTSPIDSKYYLADSSTTNTHLPRQGRCYTFDGVNDYIAIASLTGSETVISKNGTASLTISAGRIDATAGTLWDLVLSNGSRYYCNEESGTTAYDASGNAAHGTLTNITQATFHTASTSVTSNPNNTDGYRLSGSVYIPKRISSSLAADGNALTVTGRAAYHGCVETPCFTGNGSNTSITISSVLASITGDFEFTGWFKTGQTYGALWGTSTNGLYLNTLTTLRFYVGGVLTQFACTVVSGQWHYIRVTRTSGTVAMWLDNVSLTQNAGTNPNTGTITTTSLANGFSAFAFTGNLADFRFTIDGVTTYFPLQDGPGSSNTNRDIAWVKSDGTGGVISSAIVNGTVSTIWGNRVPGNVEDWCVKYGGRIAANGAFVAGMLAGGNAADGSAKTLAAGKFGNPFSRLNLNPATAAELNGRSVPTAAVVAADSSNQTGKPSTSPPTWTIMSTIDTGMYSMFLTGPITASGPPLSIPDANATSVIVR